MYNYIIIWFSFIYALVPLLIIFDSDRFLLPLYSNLRISNETHLIASILILTTYIIFNIAYKSVNASTLSIKENKNAPVFSSDFKLSLFLATIGIVSFGIFLKGYGGLSYVVDNVSKIRDGSSEVKNYSSAFLGLFSYFILVSYLILFTKKIQSPKISKKYNILLFITLIAYILKSILTGGRAGLLSIFLLSLLSYITIKKDFKLSYLLIVILLSLFIVFFGKTFLFSAFSTNYNIQFSDVYKAQRENGFFSLFVYEFNHQYISLVNFIEYNYESRLYKDFYIWILKPIKLFANDSGRYYDAISYYNSYLLLGKWSSIVPPGAVAFPIMNGSPFCLLITTYFLGWLIKKIDTTFIKEKRINSKSAIVATLYILLYHVFWYALQNGDISLIVQGRIPLIMYIIFLFISKKIILIREIANKKKSFKFHK